MPSGVHHVSCFSADNSIPAFLSEVVGLSEFDRFTGPPEVGSTMFSWPADNPGVSGARYGAGPNGLVEVITVPSSLSATVRPGFGFVTFTVKDLEARLEECRRRGFAVGDVGRFSPRDDLALAAAIVTVGGMHFELATYESR